MFRAGLGYDIHRLKKGRPLVLGGVRIKSPAGLDGHSDADVLIHSIMDSLLGAAGLKDIGIYFPNNDSRYRGISSVILLKKVYSLIAKKGYKVINVDSSLIAERPKIKNHIDRMKKNIADALKLKPSDIGIKATTNEKIGSLGKGKGIASLSVCLLGKGRK